MRSEVRKCSEAFGRLRQNSKFGFSHLFYIYFGCVRTRWDLFGCVGMRPNAFGGVWTSVDGFGRFCFSPHKPGVGKFLFWDCLGVCAISLPTRSVSAWGRKFACVRKFGGVRQRCQSHLQTHSDAPERIRTHRHMAAH